MNKALGPACLLLSFLVACGDNLGGNAPTDGRQDSASSEDAAGTAPVVISNLPASDATNVPRNGSVSATFSIPMDVDTLDDATFVLVAAAGAVPVPGVVVATSSTAAFVPTAPLDANTAYIARITRGAKSTAGVGLAADHEWRFMTGTTTIAVGVPVDLGTAANFVLLAKSGITNVPTSMITGNIGVSPITSTAITGLPLTADGSGEFSTTPQVTGRVYAPDFTQPTAANLTTAIGDMELAFTAAAGRAPDVTELGAGMIGTVTLAPGVYKWSSALLIPTSITLSGSATDVWIFVIAQDLTVSSGASILLAGGARSKNIFWDVGGQLVANPGSHLEGNVLSMTGATLDTGASLNGRLLAQTLVTIRGSVIQIPTP